MAKIKPAVKAIMKKISYEMKKSRVATALRSLIFPSKHAARPGRRHVKKLQLLAKSAPCSTSKEDPGQGDLSLRRFCAA